MSQLNTLLESAGNGWKDLQSDAAKLANKWNKDCQKAQKAKLTKTTCL